jgi:hypothetical protein
MTSSKPLENQEIEMTFKLSALFVLPMLVTGGAVSLSASPALALPVNQTCTITTYYNDAAHDEVVGTKTRCTGGGGAQMTGHTSRYSETETVTLDQGHHGGGGGNGGGGLPCEFLAKGCSPIPGQRYGATFRSAPSSKPAGVSLKPLTFTKHIDRASVSLH